ncbi:protein-arginine deiminase family protein [Amycolatopsis sp. NPDC059657]|uniref:protein-arginine deiminase family protein n=1 Tax=Amycolatopsis sp. NPDC059657 TaxID=3346899 RepID=UPI00366EB791
MGNSSTRAKMLPALVAITAMAVIGVDSAAAGPESTLRGDTVMLPNLDDDQRRCRVAEADLDLVGLQVDRRLAECGDAADEVVNGDADEADLARVNVLANPRLSAGATGLVELDHGKYARVFVRRAAGFTPLAPGSGVLTAAELRRGAELAVEGRDIIRDPAVWDGHVTITLTVTDRGAERRYRHTLQVAPLMLQHDLQPATTVFAARPGDGPGLPADGGPLFPPEGVPGDWAPFSTTLRDAARGTGAGVRHIAGSAGWWKDMWWQDLFEPAYAEMPARHGGRQVMRFAIRSANVWDLAGPGGRIERTLRPAGRLLFRDLRGPDVAVVQEFTDVSRHFGVDLRNATGNFEALPPDGRFPHGRLLYGSSATDALRPDPAFLTMLTGQGMQPPLVLDTSWLAVGHVDETVHVVRADNARRWTVMVADPRAAVALLRSAQATGSGQARLFEGTQAEIKPTVAQLLSDGALLSENESAATHIDAQIAVLLAETGLSRDELVCVPVLFRNHPAYPKLVAFTPDVVNGISLTASRFAAPDPHGPVVAGRDLFRDATERALAANRVSVRWVEDFSWAHLAFGEVHCATNAWRDIRSTRPWWTRKPAPPGVT